jgi:cytoskeleton-associated protein 5
MLSLITFSDIQETIQGLTSVKNPQQKSETLLWLCRSLKKTVLEPARTETRMLADVCSRLMDDSTPEVRDAAAEILGTLMKIVGEQPLAAHFDRMDKPRISKIKDFSEKVEIKFKPKKSINTNQEPIVNISKNSDFPCNPSNLSQKESGNNPRLANDPRLPHANPPKSRSLAPKPVLKPSNSGISSSQKPKAKPSPQELAIDKPALRFSSEEIDVNFDEFVPENIRTKLGESAWKSRLEGCEDLLEFIQKSSLTFDAEVLARALKKKPGPKESNFQIVAKVFSIFELLPSAESTFNRSVASELVPWLVEKISDPKLKSSASSCLSTYGEALSLQFILKEVFEVLKAAKSPKMISDGLVWVCTVLNEFGVKSIRIPEVIDFCKSCLDSSNATVRTNAIGLLGVVRLHVGPSVRLSLEDLKPALLSSIDVEFSKWADKLPEPPTRIEKTKKDLDGSSLNTVGEESLPLPTDLSTTITPQLLKVSRRIEHVSRDPTFFINIMPERTLWILLGRCAMELSIN